MGIVNFNIADPESFELENLNRQNGCSMSTIGRKKAEVIAELIRDINPSASIRVFAEGINEGNVEEFVLDATFVIDETEFTLHTLAVMLARAARSRGLVVLTGFNVGFGCQLTSFQPSGLTLERYLGLDEDAPLRELAEQSVDLTRWIHHIPSYVSEEVLLAVLAGETPAPSVAPGVALASGLVCSEAFHQLVGRPPTVVAPVVRIFDAIESKFEDRVVEF